MSEPNPGCRRLPVEQKVAVHILLLEKKSGNTTAQKYSATSYSYRSQIMIIDAFMC